MAEEPVVTIEVVSTKRGKCIRCPKPGRKRRVRAVCKKNRSKVEAILCLPCAKHIAIGVKWDAKYGKRPRTYDSIVEVGLLAQEHHV